MTAPEPRSVSVEELRAEIDALLDGPMGDHHRLAVIAYRALDALSAVEKERDDYRDERDAAYRTSDKWRRDYQAEVARLPTLLDVAEAADRLLAHTTRKWFSETDYQHDKDALRAALAALPQGDTP